MAHLMNFCTAEHNLIIIPEKSNGEVLLISIRNHVIEDSEKADYEDLCKYLKKRILNCAQSSADLDILDSSEFSYLRSNKFFQVLNAHKLTYKHLLIILDSIEKDLGVFLEECMLLNRSLYGTKISLNAIFVSLSSGIELSEDFRSVSKFKKYLTQTYYNRWILLSLEDRNAILKFIDLCKT